MQYTEVITDAATGDQTIRAFTPEEIAAAQEAEAASAAAARSAMSITFAQLLIGLVTEGWISEAEGDAWVDGTLPSGVTALIATLPAGQQFAARTRAKRPSEVRRIDPLVVALGSAQGKTPEEIDKFFQTYAQV